MGTYVAREFTDIVQVDLNELLDMQYAQLQTKKRFLNQLSDNQLSSALSGVSGILSIVFAMYTGASVALALGSLFASMTTSQRSTAAALADGGYLGLGEPIQFMRNTSYDLLEIELPYIEYSEWETGKTIQFISGEGIARRVHTDSGWIVL